MAVSENVVTTGSSRVFIIKHRAGPLREPIYLAQSMGGAISWGQGDVTKIEAPSDTQYNTWDQIASFQPSPDRATSVISAWMDRDDRSKILELVRLRCAFDVQIHIGSCETPTDFDGGWRKIITMEESKVTSYDTPEIGVIEGEGQAAVLEDIATSARDVYNILRMLYRPVATAEVGEEVIAIDVCDLIVCGDCDDVDPSDGCQKIFAVTNSATSSPGVLPQVIITTDQYGVNAIIERWVTSFAIGENASDGACVGSNFVVLNEDTPGVHWANKTDMINENEVWAGVITGFITAPAAIWNYNPQLSFIAGATDYIYQMKNPVDGVTVLDAGVAVTDDLNDIDGFDAENVAAVGDAGAISYTIDGTNFTAMTAPVGPTDLYAVAYRSKTEIWVAGDDGVLYVTTDYGTNWTIKAVAGALTQIDKIIWANETVGFVAGRAAGPVAVVLRTISGGYSWYVVPESPGQSLPVVDYINDMAICTKEANKLFLGGLNADGSDGVILKGSDA